MDFLGAHCARPLRQAPDVVKRAVALAPARHTAAAASSTLCKLLAWDGEGVWQQARCCNPGWVSALTQSQPHFPVALPGTWQPSAFAIWHQGSPAPPALVAVHDTL